MLLDMNNLLAIYIHKDPVDLRKGVDGYAVLIQSELERNPLDGSLYLFTNRSHNKIKGLIYNGQGFWLLYFRPEHGKFQWKISEDGNSVMITKKQLELLFDGFEMEKPFKVTYPQYI